MPDKRLDFSTFGSSVLTVFVILTGKWVEPMRQFMGKYNDWAVAVYFIQINMIGSYMLLKLFLVILL